MSVSASSQAFFNSLLPTGGFYDSVGRTLTFDAYAAMRRKKGGVPTRKEYDELKEAARIYGHAGYFVPAVGWHTRDGRKLSPLSKE